jgi:hypothetical protein
MVSDATSNVISSDKVEGSAVYNPGGRETRLDRRSYDRQGLRSGSLCRS